MSPSAPGPSIVIELRAGQRAPLVHVVASTLKDELEILRWVRTHDRLAVLVLRALDLQEEARAA